MFLILLSLNVCYFSHLGALGLVGPDEPRYAWIARDMAESGDWVTPRLYGRPWFEKPVLYYWCAALSFKLFGVSEAAARLPNAFSALFATLALAWLALRMDGWETARWVLLLLPATVGMIGFSHAAAPDMIFSATLTLAMICAAVIIGLVPSRTSETDNGNSPPPGFPTSLRYTSLALFGFFLGTAVLAKGPAAVILAGGAMILWAAFTKRWRDALRLCHPLALGVFLLTTLPWYVLCARRNPDFLRVFIVEHNFNRYLTPEFQHLQPFWYYLPITIAALLPWAFWLCAAKPSAPAGPSERAQVLFFAAWGLFPVLFFSLSKSKLSGYILPGVPALAFLVAFAVTRETKSTRNFARYALAASGVFFMVSAGAMVFSKQRFDGPLVLLYVLLAGAGGATVMAAAFLRKISAGLFCAIVLTLSLLTICYVAAGRLDPQFSARRSAAQLDAAGAAKTYSFKLQRAWQYQLNFYLHREISEWSAEIPGEALVVTDARHFEELKKSAQIIRVVYELSPQAEVVYLRPLALARNVAGGGQPR